MKAKHALVILVVGICIDFTGAVFKILHWPWADILLMVGWVVKSVGAILLLYKAIKSEKLKEFLNR